MKSLLFVRMLSLSLVLFSLVQTSFAQDDLDNPTHIKFDDNYECDVSKSALQSYRTQSLKFISTFDERYWYLEKMAKAHELLLYAKYPYEVTAGLGFGISLAEPILSLGILIEGAEAGGLITEFAGYPALLGLLSSLGLVYNDQGHYDNLSKRYSERQRLIAWGIPEIKADVTEKEKKYDLCILNENLDEIQRMTHEFLQRSPRSIFSYQWEEQIDMQVKLNSYVAQFKINQIRLKFIESLLEQ